MNSKIISAENLKINILSLMQELPFKIDMVQCDVDPSIFHYNVEVNLDPQNSENMKLVTAIVMWFWFGEGRVGDA